LWASLDTVITPVSARVHRAAALAGSQAPAMSTAQAM
jgi:hypothetical protein